MDHDDETNIPAHRFDRRLTGALAAGAQPPGGGEIRRRRPHINLKPDAFAGARSFRGDEKVVMTHDFYWYDATTNSHILDGDGSDALTTHPATLEDFSYKSVAWHKRQLRDMIDAGIDVVLPVYWGGALRARRHGPDALELRRASPAGEGRGGVDPGGQAAAGDRPLLRHVDPREQLLGRAR